MSRFLNPFKPQGEADLKGKVLKKLATLCPSCDDSSKIPHNHHTPRSAPKSFVLKGVRKVSSDKRTSVSINGQEDRTGPSSKSASGLDDRTKNPPTHRFNRSGEPRDKENTRESLDLLLGQQNTNAAYFTRRYVALPCSQRARITDRMPSETLHYCDEFDPEAFEAYRLYRESGRLELSCSEEVRANKIWMACWPIMNAAILGHVLGEPDFADRAMDLLVERLAPGIYPDIETIKQLFDENHTMIPISLRKLAVDRFLDALQHSSDNTEVSQYPSPFQTAILHAALRRLSDRSDPVVKPSRDYYSHGAAEACHTQKPEINGTLKGKERAHACEKLARDAEAVVRSMEDDGIKTFDWAYQRDIVTPKPEYVRTPMFLPRLPIGGSQTDYAVTVVVPSMPAKNEQPRSQAGESSEKPPDHDSLTPAAAELDIISIAGTPFTTNLASRYKRSLGQTFRTRSQAKADSVGHGGAYSGVTIESKPTGGDSSSSKDVGDNLKEYRKYPGAYPESCSSGSGV